MHASLVFDDDVFVTYTVGSTAYLNRVVLKSEVHAKLLGVATIHRAVSLSAVLIDARLFHPITGIRLQGRADAGRKCERATG
jgi:hypothetical protein